MNRTEYIGKLNALYVGDKNCLEELITAYDEKDKEIERLNNALKEYDRGTYCKLINENRKLNNIIKEVREYIENHSITNMEWWITGQQKIECKFMKDANPQELLELLDKGSDKE